MKSVALNAYPRAAIKRSAVKKLRATGRIPATIYGRLAPAQSLEVIGEEFKTALHNHASENLLVDLAVTGDQRPKRLALVQEIQHHPLSGKILHLDFHEVAENEKVTIQVPVESTGDAAGVKTGGGVLEHVLFKLKVRALPKDLPEVIVLDVSHLEIGQAIHIGDIVPAPGVEIIGNKEIPVLAVAAPLTEAQEVAADAAAAEGTAEPEMIKEKKDETGAPAKGAEKPDEKGAAKKAEKPEKAEKAEKKK